MRAYVFTDKTLVKQAGQFAWLSIDIDNPKNAKFLEKFPIEAVPTFLVIDPKTGKAVLTWYGTVTVPQLQKLLEDGMAVRNKPASGRAEAAMARGDQLNVQKKYVEAAAAYREALDAGGPKWSRFTRAAESMMLAYELSNDTADGAKAAMDYAPKLPRGQSFVNVMRVGIHAAAGKQTARRKDSPGDEPLKVLKPLAEEALKVPEGFADDKADIYAELISIARSAKDDAAVKKYATDMWAFLQQQAGTAPSAEARASLDGWRVSAASSLNDLAMVIPALEASERDLPADYNPPVRLASVYAQLNRPDDALAAYRRASTKAEGPRRVSILLSCAAIYEKKGDKASARSALEQALKAAEELPEKQGEPYVARIKSQLAKYEGPHL
jgi:tetratricopeptide (TPR) repeat protein